MCDSKEDIMSWRKSKPADEEAEGPMTEPRYSWGLRRRVEMLLSEIEKDIGLGKPELIDREAHFEGFRLRSIEETRRQI